MKVKGGFKMGLLLEYEQVFNDKPKDISEYLSGISQNSVLLVCSHFLGFNYSYSKVVNFESILNRFFNSENAEIKNKIIHRCKEIHSERETELNIINIETCLRLFEFAFSRLTSEQKLNEAETEVALFKAILAQNQINTRDEGKIMPSLEYAPSEIRIAMWPLVQSFKYSDYTGYDINEVFSTQVIKSSILFKFLEKGEKSNKLLKLLLSKFGSENWQSYLKMFIPLVAGPIQSTNDGYFDVVVSKDENYTRNCDFIRKLIVKDIDPEDSRDFIQIRDKPFYEVEEGTFRIIYKLFAVEKIFKGVMFQLWEINKNQPKADQIKGDFKSFWGLNFSEMELLYSVLNYTFGKGYISYNGYQISNDFKIDGGPDYYLRNGKNIFVFEAKDVLINADIKKSSDFNILEPELRKKFFSDESSGKIKPKAVLQLVECVEKILKSSFHFDSKYKTDKIEIFPVLIVFDKLYNAPGLNILLDYWFQLELSKIESYEKLDISKVNKLTIIDIDTLIMNQDLFKEKKIDFKQTLKSYSEYTFFNRKPKRPFNSLKEAQNILQNTFIPYATYLSMHKKALKIKTFPKAFKEIGFELFKLQ